MNYHFKIHRDPDGLWAECIEIKYCHTQADTEEELYRNMKEVLDLSLDEPENSKSILPLPQKNVKGKNIVEIHVDAKIAFGLYMKHLRREHNFTQKQVMEMLGMKNLQRYQRLEKKSNPRLVMLKKVKQLYPEFKIDELL